MSAATIDRPAHAARPARRVSGIGGRRAAIIAAPVLAGILATVGALADPAPGTEGRALIEAYAAEPGRVQIKSLGYHFSYAMWLPMVFGLIALVRARGAWLANVAGFLGFLGVTTMPGFILVDFMDSAAGREVGAEAAFRIGELAADMPALGIMAGTGAVAFMLSLPLAALAAQRAGLLPSWGVAAPVAGLLAFALSGSTWPGMVGMTLAFAVFAVALARIDREVWRRPAAA